MLRKTKNHYRCFPEGCGNKKIVYSGLVESLRETENSRPAPLESLWKRKNFS
jgi:hypothetical protein